MGVVILLGCDANYTEVIDGAKQETSNQNRIFMEKTPEQNTNYWFDDYQQEGDRFNLPNLAGCQLPAWDRLFSTIRHLNVNAEIINCSPISQIDVFKKMSLEDAMKYFNEVDVRTHTGEIARSTISRWRMLPMRFRITPTILTSS